jgi:MSHA biogenesis protein MshP
MALITAIFLIVVLVAIALAAVTLSSVEQDTGTKSLVSTKVYYGAKAGLDWGVQRAVAARSCVASTGPFNLTQGALSGISVTVTCSATAHGTTSCTGAACTGGASPCPCVAYFITSTATNGTLGNPNYAERHVEATVSNVP